MLASVRKVTARVRAQGARNTALYTLYRVDDLIRLRCLGIYTAVCKTETLLSASQLGYADRTYAGYEATQSYYAFRTVIGRFVGPKQSDVFLDYGSGLGKVLLMAGTFPFGKVIGVEYSPTLSVAAAQTIGSVRHRLACEQVEVVTADAREYALPDDVNVIYMFNPFRGPLLEAVVARIRESLARCPRRIVLVCHMPYEFEALTQGAGWLTKEHEIVFPPINAHPFAIYTTHAS